MGEADQNERQRKRVSKLCRQSAKINWIEKAAAITAAFFVWGICAKLLDQKILLAGPWDVLVVLSTLIGQSLFWQTVSFSLLRIALGLMLGIVLGCILAILAGLCRAVEVLLWPYMAVVKASPVASVIVLCLVWFSGSTISILISFLIVFPIVYTNVLSAIRNLDPQMEEMADVFALDFWERLFYIRLPQLESHLLAALQLSCGMAWKAGIAAEVIGIPARSIGRQLYDAKLYLATPELFAWTFVLVCMSVLFEKVILQFAKWLFALPGRRLR